MSEFKLVEKRALPYVKHLLILLAIVTVLTGLTYFTSFLLGLRVPVAYLIPFLLTYGVVLSIQIYRTAEDPLSMIPFISGISFVVGGAAFDMIATYLKTPTLAREGNPIARALLDSGHSLNFVFTYAIVSQLLYVLWVCILWGAFLKHKDTLIHLAKRRNSNSFAEFIKTATGGEKLTWRQYFLPLTLKELPELYYLVWIFPPGLIVGSLIRWYWGFVWFELISVPLSLVMIITFLLIIVVYCGWLWVEYKK